MKIKITRSKLIDALKAVQNIVGVKLNNEIIQNTLIEAKEGKVTFSTSDLDISIRTTVECEVAEEGATTLPVKLLFNSISTAAEGDIEISVDSSERATIYAGSAKFRIVGLPAKNFPPFPESTDPKEYKIEKAVLREMFRKTAYAASQDDTRRPLKGVLMRFKDSKITMVATDGRRLALVEKEIEFPQSEELDIILPSKTVAELQRNLVDEGNVTIMVKLSQATFTLDGITIYSKLIDDVYPNYMQVIPKERTETIEVDRQLLINALERASIMSSITQSDKTHSAKLVFCDNELTVTADASDIGEAKDVVPIKYGGERMEMMYNTSYIIECLKSIDDDEISIDINDPHKPAVIRCSIPFIYVIMPLRINS